VAAAAAATVPQNWPIWISKGNISLRIFVFSLYILLCIFKCWQLCV
jgi:hypothetical protein